MKSFTDSVLAGKVKSKRKNRRGKYVVCMINGIPFYLSIWQWSKWFGMHYNTVHKRLNSKTPWVNEHAVGMLNNWDHEIKCNEHD